MPATEFVLWGYKPAYGPAPIKLTGGTLRHCRSGRKMREGEGDWMLGIYARGDAPEGLRAQVAALAGTGTSQPITEEVGHA